MALVFLLPLSTFGFGFPVGIISFPILSVFLAVISKKIFKKSFDPSYWLVFFVASIVSSLIALVLWIIGFNDGVSSLLYWIEGDEILSYIFGSLLLNLGSIIFFICYLINFFIRLVRN